VVGIQGVTKSTDFLHTWWKNCYYRDVKPYKKRSALWGGNMSLKIDISHWKMWKAGEMWVYGQPPRTVGFPLCENVIIYRDYGSEVSVGMKDPFYPVFTTPLLVYWEILE
jgi:hypothetical protein